MLNLKLLNYEKSKNYLISSDYYYRRKFIICIIVGIDPDPANKEKITHWARQYYDATIPYVSKGTYVNFMMKEGEEKVKAAYGENYDRMKSVKKKYDPDNFFHINQNIKPA